MQTIVYVKEGNVVNKKVVCPVPAPSAILALSDILSR